MRRGDAWIRARRLLSRAAKSPNCRINASGTRWQSSKFPRNTWSTHRAAVHTITHTHTHTHYLRKGADFVWVITVVLMTHTAGRLLSIARALAALWSRKQQMLGRPLAPPMSGPRR